ncbi:CGNR zinc finger domain-containing protein [Saccharopolyspora taberi]|uniref:CGNR zinc finger domain-containing protein n=1 Tax=Saccharopolyspora taberi TaxID=60895 RepID=A0ABN3VBB3_9PSEU
MAYDRPAAPGALEKIESFCNSARFLYDEDAFGTPEDTNRWLRDNGYAADIDEPARQELVRLREAIRDHIESGAADALNRFARKFLLPPQWDESGVRIPTDGSVIGELLATLATEELAGRRERLKVCRSPDCRWLYYDRSPANNSVWCSMSICGARHKMRSYRKRR